MLANWFVNGAMDLWFLLIFCLASGIEGILLMPAAP